jgi:hypothetical protein
LLSTSRRNRIFVGQEEQYDFAGPGVPLKHRFLDLSPEEFASGQKAKNMFPGPGEPLKNRLLDNAKSYFGKA